MNELANVVLGFHFDQNSFHIRCNRTVSPHSMDQQMLLEDPLCTKTFTASLACERFLSGMDQHVLLEVILSTETFTASLA